MLVAARGCVRELVTIANRFGFFWGGHFDSRLDGNHFEVARVMTEKEVADALASPELVAAGQSRRLAAADLAAYQPSAAALPLLGDIAALLPRAKRVDQGFVLPPKILAVLPGGQLYIDSSYNWIRMVPPS